MLRLDKIVKDYSVADSKVHALRKVSIAFRKNELVSILGPSGCGKTTLLNIVGGLDKYSSGDLYINGTSTKEYSGRDWDNYRNHSVGFIFQSYNLIPHQSILANVELALTIAGVSKAERIARSKKALDEVGLENQYNKKPNQLSGGQCQRVAIARALVNNPEILLADEPTGALDTVTSTSVMSLIQKIAEERLVIMVTHNPEIAEKYSSRIIKLLDGEVIDDSNPFTAEEEINQVKADAIAKPVTASEATANRKKQFKAKMSPITAFRLSLQNLLTKKARTILIAVAGSIGIVGVSLVLSISYGVQNYIKSMQDDMLSGNPITIAESGLDITQFFGGMSSGEVVDLAVKNGFVNVDAMMEQIAKIASRSDSAAFVNNITPEYIDYLLALPDEYTAAVFLDYGLDLVPALYTDFKEKAASDSINTSLFTIRTIYTEILKESPYAAYADYISAFTDVMSQTISNEDYVFNQYELLDGRYPKEKDEVLIVLDSNQALTDILLAQIGYYTQEEFMNLMHKAGEDEFYKPELDKDRLSFEEIKNLQLTWYPNDTIYNKSMNPLTPFTYNPYKTASFNGGVPLKIVGIIKPNENLAYGSLSSGFYFTEALTKHVIEQNFDSEISTYTRATSSKNISSGLFVSVPAQGNPGDPDYTPEISFETGVTFKFNYNYDDGTTVVEHKNVTGYIGNKSAISSLIGSLFGGMMGGAGGASYYNITLAEIGGQDLPSNIKIYPVDFVLKDNVTDYLDAWNNEGDIVVKGVTYTKEDRDVIKYTDNLALIITMINTFINIITTALIGFTALSLVVSSVMIGIITYVSVVERIKEIGVIRSLGGRKIDVATLFIAETLIIGLVSGIIGISVTYLLSFVINLIVQRFVAGVSYIAVFPWFYAVLMVALSCFLTLVSGVFPSNAAAKKDPVDALRTE